MKILSNRILIFLILFLASCAKPVSKPIKTFYSDSVFEGMSEEEVFLKIGPPISVTSIKDLDGVLRKYVSYKQQIKNKSGGFLYKELTVVYLNNKVEKKAYSERFELKPLKGVRMTHGTIELR